MKKGFNLLFFSMILFDLGLMAQQESLISQASRDPYFVNPAYAGLEGTLVFSGHYRNQWIKLDGQPQRFLVATHFPIYKIKSGFGILLSQDKIGLQTAYSIKPSINKVWNWTHYLISTGVQLDYKNLSFNSLDARTPEGEYPNGQIDHRDKVLSNEKSSTSILDMGLSVFIQSSFFKAGLSLDHLFQSSSENSGLPYQNNREIKLIATANWNWMDLKFISGSVIYTDFNRFQSDFFTSIDYNGSIFGMMHFRGYNGNSLESCGVTAGFSLTKRLQLAYTHEFYLGGLGNRQVSGNQEMGLYYNLGKAFGLGKAPRIIHSPRYSD